MTRAAKTARTAIWHAASRLQALRTSAGSTEVSRIDAEISHVQTDLRVLDAVLVLFAAAEAPSVDFDVAVAEELRTIVAQLDETLQRDTFVTSDINTLVATLGRGRVVARTLGPLFA